MGVGDEFAARLGTARVRVVRRWAALASTSGSRPTNNPNNGRSAAATFVLRRFVTRSPLVLSKVLEANRRSYARRPLFVMEQKFKGGDDGFSLARPAALTSWMRPRPVRD